MQNIKESFSYVLAIIKKSFGFLVMTIVFVFIVGNSFGQKLKVNDLEYFETQGLNVLVFSNEYNGMFFDEKTAGIELIHYGIRTSTGGAVRLQNTPEQWDLVPMLIDRKVNKENNSIEVTLRYEELDFNSRVIVTSKDNGVMINVYLDSPLPEILEGKAGFNMEFLPASYFEKTFLADGKPGEFPLYPSGNTTIGKKSDKIPQFAGHTTFDDRGKDEYIDPKPLASGKTIVLAPEDPERYVKIQSENDISLYDGRNLAQNGWFIVRSVFPSKKSGKVLSWYMEPNTVERWIRKPNIGFSQVGYHPIQEKVAVIELDKNDTPLENASLYKITENGKYVETLTSETKQWGRFLRYNYLTFDFSSVNEPGLYFIKYGEQKTNAFSIDKNVYRDIWHSTLDVWFPVQMDHMQVNEAYRIWHGEPFKDDAIQAPVNQNHFDGYKMGPETETKYKPYERIPGLAVGGWFDAGDFDIQTLSHCSTISSFVNTWEEFSVDRDETYIDQETRYVDIHRPDGKPDVLQQIEHGSLNLVAQVKNIGYPVRGIVVPNLHQYHHLGDASTETDNLPYNPDLQPFETHDLSSGTMDDRWVFTGRNHFLDYATIATLAAANRALKGYNDQLADECLLYAEKLWNEQSTLKEETDTLMSSFMRRGGIELGAALQMYVSTKDEKYATIFKEKIWNSLYGKYLSWSISTALLAVPYMDNEYKSKLQEFVVKYKEMLDESSLENPYNVSIATHGWGSNGRIISTAITNYYAHKYYPNIISSEEVLNGLNYIFGCHPYHNLSFVASVGTRSKKITYGNNRADFSFIAGGLVPGLLILKPDFPENKDDWPFFWGENECVIGSCAEYIFLSNAVSEILKEKKQ